ncbi:unnamed protein product [Closterium sp. Yama58-4]|nr:unnamed protein product [Closterium sp. Yama58-4]
MRAIAFARRAPSRAALVTVGRHLPGFGNCPAAATPWDRRVPSVLSADRILRCDAQSCAVGTGMWGTGMWEERSGSGAGFGGSGDDGMRRECKGGARGSAWREAVARWAAGAYATQIPRQGTQVESDGATMWRAAGGGDWRIGAEARRGGAVEGPCALAGVGGRRYGVSAAGGGDAIGPAEVATDGGMRRAGGARGDAAQEDERGAEGEAEWGEAYWRKQLERSAAAERGGGKGERRRRRKAKEGEEEAMEWWPGQRQQQQQRGAGGVEEGGGADEELVAAGHGGGAREGHVPPPLRAPCPSQVAHEKAMYLPPSVRPAPPTPCAPILAGPPLPWRVEEREGVADLWLSRAFHGEQLRLMLLLQGHEGGLMDQGEEGEEGGGAGEARGSGVGGGESRHPRTHPRVQAGAAHAGGQHGCKEHGRGHGGHGW